MVSPDVGRYNSADEDNVTQVSVMCQVMSVIGQAGHMVLVTNENII